MPGNNQTKQKPSASQKKRANRKKKILLLKEKEARLRAQQPRTRTLTIMSKPIQPDKQRMTKKQKEIRTDVRVATSEKTSLALTNQLNTITINKSLSTTSLTWLVSGYLSKAFERGFAAGSSSIYVPYYALTYITNLLVNYAQALSPPVTQLPYWLLCLCHAISPKSVPFGHGLVSYKFTIGDTIPVSPTVNQGIGYQSYGFQWSTGWTSGSTIDGFPVVSVSGSSYTDVLGASAAQELFQFMQNAMKTTKVARSSKMVSNAFKTPFLSDVSAFAIFADPEGCGASGAGGGIYGLLQHEVPIMHPLLALVSCLYPTTIVVPPTRNFNWNVPISGDALTLGVLMSALCPTNQLSAKRHLRLKPIDFFEFVDVVAVWVQLIVQAAINDLPIGYTIAAVNDLLCQLSLQEMMLLLRNTMMAAFKETQSAVQGILPFLPSSSSDNEFTPFVSGVSTCSLNALDMELPAPLIENIRALVARTVKYPASEHDIVWYVPLLGQYALDTLSSSTYSVTYNVGEGPVTVSVFQTGPFYQRVDIDVKGQEVKTKMLEVAVSMVDGSSSSNLVFINDPERLKILVALWNTWLKSGPQTYSVGTGTLGTELGINVLCSIGMTRVWAAVSGQNSYKRERSSSSSKVQPVITDLRMEKTKYNALVGTPYATRKAITDVSQGKILSAPYEQVLATWILPLIDDEVINGSQSTVLQRWQFIMEEPHSEARSSSESGVTLASLHMAYAAKMTKTKLAAVDDWTLFFNEMAKEGRGGILTGIVAGILDGVSPTIGGIAHTISDMLPI